MAKSLGVGFLGAGPVTQAIHLPALATMPERFHVASVMDINADVAAAVAARCGARATTIAQATIDDPSVDVIAICSPNGFHADQLIAACEAGKKAILCEKPLAVSTDEVNRVRRVVERLGTPVLVGTMHAYDPAYRAAVEAWRETGETARFVQSSIYLPSNDRFVDQATNQITVPSPPRGGGEGTEFSARMFEAAMLGLAIHNVPIIRDFYAEIGDVRMAQFIKPFGYSVALSNGAQSANLHALMPGDWSPKWTFRVIGPNAQLHVEFPPSYVLSGSARATLIRGSERRAFSFAESGYEIQWRQLHEVVTAGAPLSVTFDVALDDVSFALALSQSGSQAIRSAA